MEPDREHRSQAPGRARHRIFPAAARLGPLRTSDHICHPCLSPPGFPPSSPTSLGSHGPCPVLPESYTPHKAPCPNANFVHTSHLLCLDPPPATQKYNSFYREPGRRVRGQAGTGEDHPRASGGNRSTGRGSQKGVNACPGARASDCPQELALRLTPGRLEEERQVSWKMRGRAWEEREERRSGRSGRSESQSAFQF